MVVQCPNCQTKFRIADDKVTEKGVRVRCVLQKCAFQVKKTAASRMQPRDTPGKERKITRRSRPRSSPPRSSSEPARDHPARAASDRRDQSCDGEAASSSSLPAASLDSSTAAAHRDGLELARDSRSGKSNPAAAAPAFESAGSRSEPRADLALDRVGARRGRPALAPPHFPSGARVKKGCPALAATADGRLAPAPLRRRSLRNA